MIICVLSGRIEEKQRASRRKREAEAESATTKQGAPYTSYEPLWFEKKKDEDAEGFDHLMHVFKGTYWDAKQKGDWSNCPNIF